MRNRYSLKQENSNMAEVSDEPCVSKEAFYKHLDTLKSKQLRKESQVTLFIEDAFFDKAKAYLKYEAEKQLGNSVRRSETLEVGNIDNHKKEVGLLRWLNNNTKQKKSGTQKATLRSIIPCSHSYRSSWSTNYFKMD